MRASQAVAGKSDGVWFQPLYRKIWGRARRRLIEVREMVQIWRGWKGKTQMKENVL